MDINTILKYLQLIQMLIAMWQQFQKPPTPAPTANIGVAKKIVPDPGTVEALTEISKQIAPSLSQEQHVKLAGMMAALVAG